MKEQGLEFNDETAKDLREKRFEFVTCGVTFRYTLQIPEYIVRRMNSELTDRLFSYMHEYATKVVCDAIRGGYATTAAGEARMRTDVGQHLKNYIWSRFSIQQEEAGNMAFEVAPTLQRVGQ